MRAGRGLRRAALACAMAVAASAWADSPDAGWTMRVAGADVVFKGAPIDGAAGTPGAMMYPAPNVAGLLVGIVAHGLTSSAMQESARNEREKAADKVLDPLRPGLAGFTEQALAAAALPASSLGRATLVTGSEPLAGKRIEGALAFVLTQDRDALVLEHSISLTQDGVAPYRNTIRVVSQPHRADDLAAYWAADGAGRLKAESAALLALSLDIAVAQAGATRAAGAQQRTVRYRLGANEVFERAEVLDEHCGRALIRNLRGWLLSVPLSKPSHGADEYCEPAAH